MGFFLRLTDPHPAADDPPAGKDKRRDNAAERDWHESSWELQNGLEVNEFFDTMPVEIADLPWPMPASKPPRG